MVRPWGFPTPLSGGRSRVLCRCRRGRRDTLRSSPRGGPPHRSDSLSPRGARLPGRARGGRDRGWRSAAVPCAPPEAVCPLGCATCSGLYGDGSPLRQETLLLASRSLSRRRSARSQARRGRSSRSIEVSDAQMHVSDAHRRVKLRTTRRLWCARHGVPFCRVRRLQGQGKGSEG
jgi:hypothetical protein